MKKLFLTLSTVFVCLLHTFGQYETLATANGFWSDSSVWNGPVPSISGDVDEDIKIYGRVTLNGTLTLDGGHDLRVVDTLIITGDLTADGFLPFCISTITVDSLGLLILLGDLTGDHLIIYNKGDVVVVDSVYIDNLVVPPVISPGNTYLYDTNAYIDPPNPFTPPLPSDSIPPGLKSIIDNILNTYGCSSPPDEAISNHTNFCEGSVPTLTLTYSGLYMGTEATAQWYDTDPAVGSPTPIGQGQGLAIAAPGSTTTYYIRFEGDPASCGSTVTSAKSVLVDVDSTVVNAGDISGVSSVCVGENDVAYSVSTISHASTYNWNYSGTGATINGAGRNITIDFAPTATSGNLTVYGSNSCGNGGTSANYAITVNPLPTPTLSSSDADNIICAGTEVTFTAGGGTNFEFKLNGTTVQNSAGTTYTTSGLINGDSVKVVVTNANGCVDSTASIITTVNWWPLPTISSSDADSVICDGDEVVFTAGGGTHYDFKLNYTILVQSGPGNTYTTSGLSDGDAVKVVVTDANGCIDSTGAIYTTVNPLPTPTLSSSDADNVICSGDEVIFTAGGGTSYEFKLNGATVQNGTGTAYTTSGLSDGDAVKVVVTNANGCIDSTTAITTTVNALPIPTLSSSDADNIICAGTEVTFTAGGGTNFEFKLNGTTVQNSAGTTYTTSGLINGDSVKVVVTNANGCVDSTASIITTVNWWPLPTISSSDADSVICDGDEVVFTAGGGTHYDFKLNYTILVQSGPGNTYTTSGLSDGDAVKVVVTDANGCIDSTGAIYTKVNPLPTPTLSSSDADNIICAGDEVIFTAGGGTSYEFKLNGATVQNGTGTTYTTSGLSDGDAVKVVVTNANGCIDSMAAITTNVNALPIPTLSSSDGDNIICAGTEVIFTAGGGANYEFKLNGTTVQNGANTTYTTSGLTDGDAMKVVVTNANGCIDSTAAITTTVNTLPTPTLSSSDADNIICAGDEVIFTAGGGTNYEFKLNGATVQNGAGTSYTTSGLSDDDAVKVLVTNANGCADSTASITTTVNDIPTITGTIGGERCDAGTVGLSALASAGDVNWYVASIGGPSIYTGTNYTTPSIGATTSYWVDAIANGCVTASRTEVVATVNTSPSISTATIPEICNGDSYDLTNIVVADANSTGASYTYHNATPANAGNELASTIVSPVASTNYFILADNASCTDEISVTVSVLSGVPSDAGTIAGSISACQGETNVAYSIDTIENASSYSWNFTGNGATINGSSTAITIDFAEGATNGDLTVQGENVCGSGNPSVHPIILNPGAPDDAGSITGTNDICQGENGIEYSIATIQDAVNYIWSYTGTGATINGIGTTITIDFAVDATSGDLTVYGDNSCGTGGETSLSIIVNSGPAGDAGTITGTDNVCQGENSVPFSVPSIANAVGYVWGYSGTGATINGTGPSITIDFAPDATAGEISVYGENSCGSGAISSHAIIVNTGAPGAADVITGNYNVCQGENSLSYNIPSVTGAAGYSWTFTGSGVAINGSGESVSLDFNTKATSGDLSVYATNSCGDGASAILTITVNEGAPDDAGAITGPDNACQGESGVVFTVEEIPGAYTYHWDYTGSGATIIDSGRTAIIDFDPLATRGDLSVYASNSCGSGNKTSYAIKIHTSAPDNAETIAGDTIVCTGSNSIDYMVPILSTANTYNWTYSGTGATINGTGNEITIDFDSDATSGELIVSGVNGCGEGGGSEVFLVELVSEPDDAGEIAGEMAVCPDQVGVSYSVEELDNVETYNWEYTGTGIQINGDGNTVTIDFDMDVEEGILTVYAENQCGTGNSSPDFEILLKPQEECASMGIKEITNVFSPNGDGINDLWIINEIENFPNAKVEVFDRWGRRVFFKASNYSNADPWDGKYKGTMLPYDNYFYTIDLYGNGKVIYKDNLTIIK